MNTQQHIDELAELYALGTLDEAQRAGVDAHVRACAVCAKRVGEAEALIAQTIQDSEPPASLEVRLRKAFKVRTGAPPRWLALVAAAFVLGLLLPGMLFTPLYHRTAPSDLDRERAISAMVNGHFLHAQFTALTPGSPKAKVLYGRSVPWRYFVAQTNHAYTVAAQSAGGTLTLGTMHVNGDAAELFVDRSSARTFLLLDGTHAVARVTLP